MKQGYTWIKVLWKTGYKSWVKLEDLKHDDPLKLINYAQNNQLSNLEEWKWTNNFNQNLNLFEVMVQNTSQSLNNTYKFGVRVPKTAKQALQFDKEDENSLWKEAIDKEINEINEYQTFKVLDHTETLSYGYKQIPYHLISDVKFDG